MVSGGLIYGRAVPVKAEPLQVVHDEVGRSGDDTWFVDVFDAQVDCVVAAACGKPCTQHRVDVADVHAA